jgi:hypothetical protein
MKLGYIHNNREEQMRVLQVLKMTSESVALDELGIGRIRDAFADRMFPGISTLQKHTKYFSLMPQLYRKAIEKRYNRPSEVKAEIIRLERIMTEKLFEGSTTDKRGITGSDMIGKNCTNYVKYDPAYIYNSGLQTFEILRSPQLYELIYSASKALHDVPKACKSDAENTADDSEDKSGLFQFCSFPAVNYDFTQRCSLDLTMEDRDFIVDHILKADACKGTLLRYIVDNPSFVLTDAFENIPVQLLPTELGKLQDLARRFADFMYMVHIRYNYIYSKYEDEEMLHKFEEELEKYRNSGTEIDKVLAAIDIRENSGKCFCKDVAECIVANDIKVNGGLDQLIINREHRAKGFRRKIDNSSYVYDKKNRIHFYKLTYRWETVKLFADELRKEVIND